MPSFPSTAPLECNRIIMCTSPLYFSVACNSGSVSLPRRVPRKVCKKQSLNWVRVSAFDGNKSESGGAFDDNEALDAVLQLYSALKNNNTQELSDILADECRCVCNFLSFFQAFQGKKQVLEFFSYLIRIFGKNVHIVVKPTLQDGMYVGVEWKFGFQFSYMPKLQGKGFDKIEMFMEPLLYFEPFRLKMMGGLTMLMEKIGSFMVLKSENKVERSLSMVLALLSLAAFLFFFRLASSKAVS